MSRAKAARRYKRFTGHDVDEETVIDVQWPKVVSVVGQIDGILYTTVRDGRKEKYIHHFRAQSRPHFAVSPDGKMLLLVGGRFKFTERGIVDK